MPFDLPTLAAAFLTGLIGSVHCLAMCGGIATSLGAASAGAPIARPRLGTAIDINVGRIAGYVLRMQDQKRHAVEAFRKLNFHVVAAGDSFNDTTMLAAAHAGIFFCPPDSIAAQFPQFPVTRDYAALRSAIRTAMADAAAS